jgi:hypothetical protein
MYYLDSNGDRVYTLKVRKCIYERVKDEIVSLRLIFLLILLLYVWGNNTIHIDSYMPFIYIFDAILLLGMNIETSSFWENNGKCTSCKILTG